MLTDKAILVTGGSKGIGAQIVRTAIESGAQVAFTYWTSEGAALALSRELTALYPGQQCIPLKCDVADREAMEALADKVLAQLGRIDALINNAGITQDAVLARMSRDQWDTVITTNLGSMFNATKPLLLPMVKQGSGSIVNMTSLVAIYGMGGQTNYAAAKGGIIGFTKSLSAEVGPRGVRVNAVAPGYIRTDMSAAMMRDTLDHVTSRISLQRLGTVQDVAPLVCFLASDLASYITGQIIQVDGGITL
ncbi:MAG: 3-oxoacyl-ACP reductase FabG [Acidobacteriota bacterium]